MKVRYVVPGWIVIASLTCVGRVLAGSCSTPDAMFRSPFGGQCSLSCSPGGTARTVSLSGVNARVSLVCPFSAAGSVSCSTAPGTIHCSAADTAIFQTTQPCRCVSRVDDVAPVPQSPEAGLVLAASCSCN